MKYLGLCIFPLLMSIPALGVTCANGGSLATYIGYGVGGCQLGLTDTEFTMTNWAYVSAAVLANSVAANNVEVNYSFNGSGVPQISFTGSWAADSTLVPSTNLGVIGFSLEATNPNFRFTSNALTAGGSVSDPTLGLVPTGTAGVVEVNCVGGLLDRSDNSSLLGLNLTSALDIGCLNGGVTVNATANLTPGVGVTANVPINLGIGDNFIDVIKVISVTDAGLLSNGFASVSTVGQGFDGVTDSNVPEPSAYLLTGLGLVGLGWFNRRRSNSKGN